MEWLHIGQGLEWWQSIIVTTVIVRSAKLMSFFTITSFITRFNLKMWMYFRLIVTPVVVYAQRNMAHMTNNAPEMARLQVCNIKWHFVRGKGQSTIYLYIAFPVRQQTIHGIWLIPGKIHCGPSENGHVWDWQDSETTSGLQSLLNQIWLSLLSGTHGEAGS